MSRLGSLGLLLGTFVLLASGAGCHRETAAAPARPPAPVTVTSSIAQDVPVYLDEIGTCQAIETVDILPQVSGQIVAIGFIDGQDVKKGDLLFTIDRRPYEAKVAQQEASLAEAQANLDLADVQFKRISQLHDTDASTQSEFDQAKAAVKSSQARVTLAEANIRSAKLDLEYTRITSPINGRVGQRQVDLGNVIKSLDKPLLRIENMSPIYVTFTTVEQNLERVRQAMGHHTLITEVSIPNQPASLRHGELTFLDNSIMPQSGRLRLRATLTNKDREFWPGQFVNVRLILNTVPQAVLVPFQATQISQQGPFVYVVTPQTTAELRLVKLGQRQGDNIVIESGLKAQEQVILTGQFTLTPNAPVRILGDSTTRPAEATPSAAPSTAPAGGAK